MTVLDTEDVTVRFDPAIPAVRVIHHRGQTTEEFRRAIGAAITAMEAQYAQYPNANWLADTRRQGVLSSEDLAWCDNEMRRRLPWLKRVALLVPSDIFGQISIEAFTGLSETQQGYVSRPFDEEDRAIEWLQQS